PMRSKPRSRHCALNETPPSPGCVTTGYRCRYRRQLRAVRPVRRPTRDLARSTRSWCADQGDWAPGVPAGVHRYSRGNGRIPRRTEAGDRSVSRTAKVERATSESSVSVEVDLDGSGVTEISTTVP